jgi:A/G-specific adenine glycosylase
MEIGEFRETVLSRYRKEGRKLPWRGADPWGVMVSEFMLQQTRVERVMSFWENWMRLWPNPASLAGASGEEVMRAWSGLGYNRRCYFLKSSASVIAKKHNNTVPEKPEKLRELPGVGPYMAGAIACFGYNSPEVFIETNIRSAAIHCFFPGRDDVRDREIFPILEAALDRRNPRTWYYALMDYGAVLKKTGNPGRRSAHYTRQSAFIGSFRQARGKVIRTLASMGPSNIEEIETASGLTGEKLYRVLEKLENESMVAETKGIYRIKD